MNKKTILTVLGLTAALALGAFAAMAYVNSALERERDTLQQVMSEQFAVFDKDGDQFLSQAELEVFARNTYQSIVRGDESPAQQDRAEFIALFRKNANGGQGAEKVEHDAQTMFNHADINEDDILTEAEYIAFYMNGLKKMGWPEFESKGVALVTGPRAPAGN